MGDGLLLCVTEGSLTRLSDLQRTQTQKRPDECAAEVLLPSGNRRLDPDLFSRQQKALADNISGCMLASGQELDDNFTGLAVRMKRRSVRQRADAFDAATWSEWHDR